MQITDDLKSFLLSNRLLSDEQAIGADDSLFESGVIDSLAIVELTSFIEKQFNCRVDEDDLVPENFDSLNAMTAYVQRKINAGA